MEIRRAALALLVLTGALTLVSATPPAAAADRATLFPKGATDLALYGSYAWPVFGSDEHYYSAGVGAGYYFADNLSVNLALVGHDIQSPSAVAVEANLLLRWHVLTLDRFTLFLDGGVGLIYSDHELPNGGHGTHWDFTPQAGVGVTYRLDDHLHLLTGLRLFHASNANLNGSDRHCGSNALGAYAGLMWTF